MAARHEQIENIEKTLKNYKLMKDYIEFNIDLINSALNKNTVTYPSPSNLEIEKTGQTFKFHSTVENDVLRLDEVYTKYLLFKHTIDKIDLALERLSTEEEKIIKLFYIEKKSWVAISFNVGIGERQCQRIRDEALLTLQLLIYGQVYDKKSNSIQLALDLVKI